MTLVIRRADDSRQTRAAHVVGCLRSGEAIVFDPPRDVDQCIELAARDGLRIAAVAETRVHGDFLSGARELAERTGALVLVSGAGGSAWTPHWVSRYAHRLLRDGDTHDVGGVRVGAMHLPGFTSEQVAYLIFDHRAGATQPLGVVAGDFLSPDFQHGSEHASNSQAAARALREIAAIYGASLERFLALPEWVQVWPLRPVRTGSLPGAFMPQTTIGCERRFGRWGTLADDRAALALALAEPAREALFEAPRIRQTNLEGVPTLARMPSPVVLGSLEERPDLLDPDATVVVDTRAWTVFRSGHLPGAIHAPTGRAFMATVGTLVEPDERVVLVCDPANAPDLVRECVRVGVDRVEAVVSPGLLHRHRRQLRVAPEIGVAAAAAAAAGDTAVLDVRSGPECARGMVAGAIRVPMARLRARADEFRGRRVIAYCGVGQQSATAVSLLRRHGADAANVTGGFEAWKRAGAPIVVPGGFDADPACHLGLAPARTAMVG